MTLGLSDYDCIEPDFTWIDNTLTDIFQDKNESNKNYIIIVPESVALESPRGNIWHKVVEVAHSHNCIVLENSALKNVLQYGDVAINQSIEEAYIAAKKAVAVVSSRSGLADLLAFSKCKLIVLYPLNPIFREKFTFSNMPFSEHVVEFYENESDEIIKCIDRIISTTI